MSAHPATVFFYGLFMDAEALRANGFHPINARQACVVGMAVQIGKRATLVPDPAKCVYGFVIGLSQEEVARLYSEPSVAEYRPDFRAVRRSAAAGGDPSRRGPRLEAAH